MKQRFRRILSAMMGGEGIAWLLFVTLPAVALSLTLLWYIAHCVYYLDGVGDIPDGEPVKGTATVEKIEAYPFSRNGPYEGPTLTLRIGNAHVEFAASVPVRIGDEVPVFYKRGKSGMVYVARIEPVTANARPSQ